MHPRRCRAHQVLAPRQALVQLVEVQKVVEGMEVAEVRRH